MESKKRQVVGSALLLIGGASNLLHSIGLWQIQLLLASGLALASGLVMCFSALCSYLYTKQHVLWGVLALFYSTLGITAMGLAQADYTWETAIVALLTGTLGSILTITKE